MTEPRDAIRVATLPIRRVARPRSLATLVVDQIRELIVTGRLALGEQISENALADRLGTSRTPVREAFLRLEAERLVEVRPQRGTFVFSCDEAEAREICELREILETGALRLAVAQDLPGLAALLAANVRAGSEIDLTEPADYQPIDQQFHETILEASGNRQLIESYGRIAARVSALRYRLVRTARHAAGSQQAHGEVVAYLQAGDTAAAEASLRHHVYASYRGLLELLQSGGSLDQARS